MSADEHPAQVAPTIPTRALAEHWGVSTAYVRGLRTRAEAPMPSFVDLGSDAADRFTLADEWRARHAPARRRRLLPDAADGKRKESGGECSAPSKAAEVSEAEIEAERARIGEDFEGWAVAAAERAALRADRRYREAMTGGDDVRIANALTVLNEALRRAREQRAAWLDLQERARRLISVDRAHALLAPVLLALERRLKALGVRVGPDANPQDAARAQRAIDREVDLICDQLAGALQVVEEMRDEPESDAIAAA